MAGRAAEGADVLFVVGCESPTAQPSVAESMKSEFSLGLAGGLMYAVGLVSLQIPITAVAGVAETVTIRIRREIAVIAIENFNLRIRISRLNTGLL
jgi:hypothetical protein